MSNEELVRRYKDGEFMVLDELTRSNIKLIQYIANKYTIKCSFIDYDDLAQQGWTGFFRAVQTYDADHPSKAKFSTWAILWIKQAIQRFLEQKTPKNELSLQEPLNDDGLTYEDKLEADDSDLQKMWHGLEVQELHRDLDKLMKDNLTLQQQEILKLHYGWDCLKQWTFEELGELFGFSKSRAYEIHNKALRILRRTAWVKRMLEDRRKEIKVKTAYYDPLAALMQRHEKYGRLPVEGIINRSQKPLISLKKEETHGKR